jgi:hypothetical protein
MAFKYKQSALTVRQKFFALRKLHYSISLIDGDNGKWRLDLSGVDFSKGRPEPGQCEGETSDDAINETWFWITMEDYKDSSSRFVGPAEKNAIIRTYGEQELWFEWQDFMWWPIVIQRRGYRKGKDLELTAAK